MFPNPELINLYRQNEHVGCDIYYTDEQDNKWLFFCLVFLGTRSLWYERYKKFLNKLEVKIIPLGDTNMHLNGCVQSSSFSI